MTSRILPPEEWPNLRGTEAETIWPALNPSRDRTQIVVVEQDGEIIGCHVLTLVLHAECLWIHPAHRGKAGVARRLWARVIRTAHCVFQARTIATAATSDDVRKLLTHVGAIDLPGTHHVIPLGDS